MQVILETTSSLGRRMKISVPAEQLDSKVEAKLKETAGQVRIKGFRPGKVPMREVKRRFGDGIRQEVSSEIMQMSFAEAIQQEAVSPAGLPQIEDVSMEAGKDLEFTAVFEVFPEISIGDFSQITVERPVSLVTEADIDQMTENLRSQRAQFNEVERPCEDGDRVNVDFEGFVDGEAFDGGKAEGSDIVLGSGSMIPGFEDGIIGGSQDEEKELSVTFPEDYQSEELAGKDAVFKVKINSVSESEKPELNDEFFGEFGVTEGGVEAFREEIKSNMDKELEAAVKNKVKNQVMDGLIATNEIEIPKALIDQQVDRLRHDAVHQFGGHDKIDPSLLPAEMFVAQAERQVSLGLLVNAIVETHEIKPDDERVRTMIESMASSYEEPEQIVNYYYSNEEQLSQVQNLVLEDQIVEKILEEAVVEDVELEYEEAIKPIQPSNPPEAEETEAETADAEVADAEVADAEVEEEKTDRQGD